MLVSEKWTSGTWIKKASDNVVGEAEQSTLIGAWEIGVLKANVNYAGLAQLSSEGKNIS